MTKSTVRSYPVAANVSHRKLGTCYSGPSKKTRSKRTAKRARGRG